MNGENQAYVDVVDAKGRHVDVDYRYYSGATANLLKAIDSIQSTESFNISWSAESASSGVSLTDNPHLLYLLTLCNGLICDHQMHQIKVASQRAQLAFCIEPMSAESSKLQGKFEAVDGESGETLGKIFFLSDSFVLVNDSMIYPITSVGDNYNDLSIFADPIEPEMLDAFLSIFFSYTTNIDVRYGERRVRHSEAVERPTPALVFEKVDADEALYIRVTQVVGSLPPDIAENFDINVVATVTDTEIVLHRFEFFSVADSMDRVLDEIKRHVSGRAALKAVYHDDNLIILPKEVAGPFLFHGLPVLLREYRLIGAEKLREYKITPAHPKLNLRLSSGIDFLEGDASVEIGTEKFTLAQILAQYRKNKYVQLSDGNRAIVDENYIKRLERIFHKPKDKDGKVKVSFFDLPEVEALMEERIAGAAFKRHREVYEGFNKLASQRFRAPQIKGTLRPYQREGVKWIKYLYDQNLGGCLADDMGLGKTIQTIATLASIYSDPKQSAPEDPTLIVMPRSLIFNWTEELAKFAPQLTVGVYYGTARNLTEALKAQVVLTTYALVRNDIEQLKDVKFHYVVLDESQNIKNLNAQMTQAVFMLKAEHRLAISGTPVENNLTELFSLFHFLNPAMFGSLEQFNTSYAAPIQRDNDNEALDSLRRKIFPFILRRVKKDVLPDLPDRVDRTLYVEMEPDHRAFYEQRRKAYLEEINSSIAASGVKASQFVMFQALSELRRVASIPESLSDASIHSPKLDMLIDQVVEAVENGHKTVVFFNFIAGIELAGEMLEKHGIDYATMTGSTSDRASVVRRFQTDPKCAVMLMTIKTGGVGLNLTAADMVFIFEPWWNKAAEEQAINRLHRIGQKSTVYSYSLIVRDTIEEKIRQLQEKKAELFEGLIGTDSASTKVLSEEDINFILS